MDSASCLRISESPPLEKPSVSPMSLCENQMPSAREPVLSTFSPTENISNDDHFCIDSAAPAKTLTLGQTLRNELRKSSLKLQNNRNETVIIGSEIKTINQADENAPKMEDTTQNATLNSINTTQNSNGATTRRRRPRRNPVWQYFHVDDGQVASCKACSYTTKSIFSTNLKVHLKSHHRRLFEQVLQAEEEMAAATENAAHAMRTLRQNIGHSKYSFDTWKHKNGTDCPSTEIGELQRPFNAQFSAQLKQRQKSDSSLTAVNSHIFDENNRFSEAKSRKDKLDIEMLQPTNYDSQTQMTALADLLANAVAGANSLGLDDTNIATLSGHSISFQAQSSSPDKQLSSIQLNGSYPRIPGMNDGGFDKLKQKRKRLRRHPVWTYFSDFDDKIVGCIMCNFRTTSAFSTNLKMHLRAHHKQEYLQVMEAELEQCVDGQREGAEGSFDAAGNSAASAEMDFSSKTGRGKRRRKTAEEIQVIIEKCKNNLEKEREKRNSLFVASARCKLPRNSTISGEPVVHSHLNGTLTNDSLHTMSSSEQLNAMIGMLCNNSSIASLPSDMQNSESSVPDDWSSCHDFSKDSLEFPGLNDSVGKISPGQSSPVLDELSELITQLSSITETDQNKELLSSLRKQARDFAFAKLVHAAGAPDLFLSPEFQMFVYALAPDYNFMGNMTMINLTKEDINSNLQV
ncbi:BED zinc finger domain-containing protein [Ditylenchus destructor]|uniref:BED zinc finger domain-containing protein n=1 Tax=Ditylenchus destructor TaxID=166010 RepID=A0AAD4NKS1_9BILA|nr:BED zinc finger domain-containing protein [Ditylenchus destructor]